MSTWRVQVTGDDSWRGWASREPRPRGAARFRNGTTRRTLCARIFLDHFHLEHLLRALIDNGTSAGISLVESTVYETRVMGQGKSGFCHVVLPSSFEANENTGWYLALKSRTATCCSGVEVYSTKAQFGFRCVHLGRSARKSRNSTGMTLLRRAD